jgi:hypothetical protein
MAEKKPYNPKRPEFDAYDKNASRRRALGDENIKTIVRGGGIQSADYVPGVSGWILASERRPQAWQYKWPLSARGDHVC